LPPFISVIIPTYNRPESVRAAVESVLGQDYPGDRFEVIVADDGSDPPLSLGVERVRIVRELNRGPASARNRGAEIAEGEFLAFLDDDCVAETGWLRSLAFMAPSGRAIGGATINGVPENACACATDLLVDQFVRRRQGFLPSNNFAAPAVRFREIGGFDESFRVAGGEDRDFCRRWIARGYEIAHCADARVSHHHAMSFGQFLRQHYNYGRGALRLRRVEPTATKPLAFLVRLLSAALERRSMTLAFLLCCSQLATAAGFARGGISE
jgi:glycosyltransferase involved in cell wall biosynthesis